MIAFLAGLLSASVSIAAIIPAASVDYWDVSNAVYSASDGDTVTVPAGSATWSNTVITAKAISIIGAGAGSTVLTYAGGIGWQKSIFWFNPSATNKSWRVSGFTFIDSTNSQQGSVSSANDINGFRVDHCTFDPVTSKGVWVRNIIGGVIDHCTFRLPTNITAVVEFITILGDHDDSWARTTEAGGTNMVVIEDCLFDVQSAIVNPNHQIIQGYDGVSYCFRHNTVTNGFISHHGCDTGSYRSTKWFEVYDNTFNSNYLYAAVNLSDAFYLRGGSGVIWSNTINGSFSQPFISLINFRSTWNFSYVSTWGLCTGTNIFDGNVETNGYPCLDQIGRTTSQAAFPLYGWANTINGTNLGFNLEPSLISPNSPNVTDHIKAGRDYTNAVYSYTPLVYPHPLVTAQDGGPPKISTTDWLIIGTLKLQP